MSRIDLTDSLIEITDEQSEQTTRLHIEMGTLRHISGCCEALHGSFVAKAAALLDMLDPSHLFTLHVTFPDPAGDGHNTAIYEHTTLEVSHDRQHVITLFAVAEEVRWGLPVQPA